MKKTKWFKSLGVAAALAMPVATVMTTFTSCAKKSYSDLVSEMKDDCVSKFIAMSKDVHRNAWNEAQACSYVKKEMQGLGYIEPTGEDSWTKLNAVKLEREKELEELAKYDEPDYGDYGNLWYDIAATPGFENVPGVIIHCHMDSPMYFGNASTEAALHKKWVQEGIDVEFDRDNEVLKAKNNMSLGADGGVGICALLTIAKYQKRFNHGPIRLLFAVGESEPVPPNFDTAKQIKYPEYSAGFHLLEYDQTDTAPAHETEGTSFIHKGHPFGDNYEYRYLISTSGITQNTISISSSGVHECQIEAFDNNKIDLNNDKATKTGDGKKNKNGNLIDWDEKTKIDWQGEEDSPKKYMQLSISGLQGGATSSYINNNQGSAVRMLAETLYTGDVDMQLISSQTYPNSPYSISTEATAKFASFYNKDTWQGKIDAITPTFKDRWPNEDWKNVKIEITELTETPPAHGISKKATRDMLGMLANELYFGPISWFENGDIKTSENQGPFNVTITEGTSAKADIDFRLILRSSDILQLEIFKHLTHSIFRDGFGSLFGVEYSDPDTKWDQAEEKYISHIHDPAWEAPTVEKPNKLLPAFEKAFGNFKIKPKVVNEHGWIEISCADDILNRMGKEHHMVLVGVQIDNHHSSNEVLYTDSIVTMLETIVYVLDNSDSLLPVIKL